MSVSLPRDFRLLVARHYRHRRTPLKTERFCVPLHHGLDGRNLNPMPISPKWYRYHFGESRARNLLPVGCFVARITQNPAQQV